MMGVPAHMQAWLEWEYEVARIVRGRQGLRKKNNDLFSQMLFLFDAQKWPRDAFLINLSHDVDYLTSLPCDAAMFYLRGRHYHRLRLNAIKKIRQRSRGKKRA